MIYMKYICLVCHAQCRGLVLDSEILKGTEFSGSSKPENSVPIGSHLHFKVFMARWTVGDVFPFYFWKTDGCMAVRALAVYVSVAVLPFSFLKTEKAGSFIVLVHVIIIFFLSGFKVPGQTAIQEKDHNDQSQCVENTAACHQVQREKDKIDNE